MKDLCRTALQALDRAVDDRPDQVYEDMVAAVRALVRLRDSLITERRAGKGTPEHEERLRRVNAVLSMVVGGEYPLIGIRKERITKSAGRGRGAAGGLRSGRRRPLRGVVRAGRRRGRLVALPGERALAAPVQPGRHVQPAHRAPGARAARGAPSFERAGPR